MRIVGMLIGGLISLILHVSSFVLKNLYIQLVRFVRDDANAKTKWTIQAVFLFPLFMFTFIWMVGRYQDIVVFDREPATLRSIPLLLVCFFGHTIYDSPVLRKNIYAKTVIQTLLNTISVLALGQILISFIGSSIGIVITFIMLTITIFLSLRLSKHSSLQDTMFSRLHSIVEKAQSPKRFSLIYFFSNKTKYKAKAIYALENTKIDLSQKGCLSHLRYYSEDCRLELFWSVPTLNKQSKLQVLKKSDRAQHTQILGGTGSGKTLFAATTTAQDFFNDAIGSTIVEPKGTFVRRSANLLDRIGRNYYRLDPDIENSDCLNPLYVTEGKDFELMIEANISAFHAHLGPEAKQYFKSRSTQLLRVCIKALKLAYGNECGFDELNEIIQPFGEELRTDTLFILQQKKLLNQVQLLNEYHKNLGTDGKIKEFTMQTYSSLHDYMLELTSNAHIRKMFCGKSTFNIDDVLEKGEIVLFNAAFGKLQTLTYTVGRLYLNLLRASTFRRDLTVKFKNHSLVIDEIEMFGDEEFSTFLEMAREYNVFVTSIHQGNEQLNDVSRRLAAMMKQNAVQKFILAGLEVEDAEYYAKLFTDHYKQTLSSGTDEMSTTGFNTQEREEKRYLVDPSDFLRLKGFNPRTGEPAECYFRGVIDNVRLEPIFAEIYPLPQVLFTPLGQENEDDVKEWEEDRVEKEDESIVEPMDNRIDPPLEKPIGQTEKLKKEEDIREAATTPSSKRNPLWDAKKVTESSEAKDSSATEPKVINIKKDPDIDVCGENTVTIQQPIVKEGFDQAIVGDAALNIAKKVRHRAVEERNKKKENEAG
ncbi:type IV secretory system conjugative DNA transfer family protein [Paenibacillus polymyxa]|uniref:type IV secretory system conjugative DNA transfer family protein n=1 Tax=Paenibacillus polymyxa TaxID=1406 RepID=UPI00307DD108